jgi:F0F1-type ATP synthase assembly protein I
MAERFCAAPLDVVPIYIYMTETLKVIILLLLLICAMLLIRQMLELKIMVTPLCLLKLCGELHLTISSNIACN